MQVCTSSVALSHFAADYRRPAATSVEGRSKRFPDGDGAFRDGAVARPLARLRYLMDVVFLPVEGLFVLEAGPLLGSRE